MRKTKKTYANGFYIFESRVAANSNYIESISEAKKLMIYANCFLKDYLLIHDYIITRHGWQMAVQLADDSQIISSYEKRKAGKSVVSHGDTEIWKIISERMRLFISTYAKQVNFSRGRSGSLVHSVYTKSYFETLSEAERHLSSLRNQTIKFYQRRKKYRGLKTHYKITKIIGKGSIFLCSRDIKKDGERLLNFMKNEVYGAISTLVVADLINFTQNLHNPTKTTENSTTHNKTQSTKPPNSSP